MTAFAGGPVCSDLSGYHTPISVDQFAPERVDQFAPERVDRFGAIFPAKTAETLRRTILFSEISTISKYPPFLQIQAVGIIKDAWKEERAIRSTFHSNGVGT